MKQVSRIDGKLVMRPGKDHPDNAAWLALKDARRTLQRGSDGRVYCGACWRTEDAYPFDLHHRHYDNFGAEHLGDVVLLCRSCHEAITSRIRSERFALGDRSLGIAEEVAPSPAFRPTLTRVTVEVATGEAIAAPRFRPNISVGRV